MGMEGRKATKHTKVSVNAMFNDAIAGYIDSKVSKALERLTDRTVSLDDPRIRAIFVDDNGITNLDNVSINSATIKSVDIKNTIGNTTCFDAIGANAVQAGTVEASNVFAKAMVTGNIESKTATIGMFTEHVIFAKNIVAKGYSAFKSIVADSVNSSMIEGARAVILNLRSEAIEAKRVDVVDLYSDYSSSKNAHAARLEVGKINGKDFTEMHKDLEKCKATIATLEKTIINLANEAYNKAVLIDKLVDTVSAISGKLDDSMMDISKLPSRGYVDSEILKVEERIMLSKTMFDSINLKRTSMSQIELESRDKMPRLYLDKSNRLIYTSNGRIHIVKSIGV
jgi:hypothetical protein